MKVPGKEVFGVFPIPTGPPACPKAVTVPTHRPACLLQPPLPGDLLTAPLAQTSAWRDPLVPRRLPSSWEPGTQGSAQGRHLWIPQARGGRSLDAALPNTGPGTSSSGLWHGQQTG